MTGIQENKSLVALLFVCQQWAKKLLSTYVYTVLKVQHLTDLPWNQFVLLSLQLRVPEIQI